ncbi:translation initiation factor [Leptobacterium sp. I13]|uniref:translation initiation factor n=1 Tax=Leptobacterium meishanense TaxID=3128904 RepID=UPI0030EB38EB
MTKKLNSLEDLSGFVFSTDDNFTPESSSETDESNTLSNADQRLEAHFSNKGRGGKTVTIIKGFQGSEEALKKLAKLLKTKCGVGGSVKESDIIVQGNYRDKIIAILQSLGYKVKRVGG